MMCLSHAECTLPRFYFHRERSLLPPVGTALSSGDARLFARNFDPIPSEIPGFGPDAEALRANFLHKDESKSSENCFHQSSISLSLCFENFWPDDGFLHSAEKES